MNAPVTIKGWCPGALRPMRSGDGLLVRVRIRDATLRPADALALADMARRFGNGDIDLTRRANLQIRGVREVHLPALNEALRACDMIGAEEDAGQAVNIVTSPLAGLDATLAFDPRPMTRRIEAALLADEGFRALPSKFGYVIDGGGALPLDDSDADIRLRATREHVAVRLAGSSQCVIVGIVEAADFAMALTRAFLTLRAGERRMRALVERLGAAAVFSTAGLTPHGLDVGDLAAPDRHRFPGLFQGDDHWVLGVAAPFGAWNADDLAMVARIATMTVDATLRVTPSRVVLIAGLPRDGAMRAFDELATRALIVTPNDPRLAIACCAGAPACEVASVPTRNLAQALASSIGPSTGVALHVAGCAKGCAHPHAAALTLVGHAGHYDLVRSGRSDAIPALAGLDFNEAILQARKMLSS